MHIFHKWKLHHSTGKYNYYECKKCKARKYIEVTEGYQPLDYDWLTFKKIQHCPNCKYPVPPKLFVEHEKIFYNPKIFKKEDYQCSKKCQCGIKYEY